MSASTTAPKLPIEIVNNTIDSFDSSEIMEIIKQNVKMVILTYPGERIMQPDFGVGPARFLFDQELAFQTYADLQFSIRSQLGKYIPSIRLTTVSATPGEQEHQLDIFVSYEVDFLQTKDQLDLRLEY